jgi:hypothetical protein
MAGVLAANRGVETTHENEWFTPQEHIELARKFSTGTAILQLLSLEVAKPSAARCAHHD